MELFKKFGLSHELLTNIESLGITTPTQIQGLSIPNIIQGKDVIGESATGSGKTLAFGCGIIEKVQPNQGLQALILTPTRELAEQVKDNLRQLTRKLKVITIYGGVAIGPQIDGLKKADVVVATPGRLLDHLQRRTINTSKINILVLDEADRMFDMGFIDDVEKIISQCPKKRQTMFFSATISERVKQLGKRHMVNPSIVAAKNQVDPSKLKQVYYNVDKGMKLSLLVHLLKEEKSGLVMVFCNTRRTVDFIVKNLKGNDVKAIAIHGGLTQNKRTKTIEMFNDAKAGVLVCTDVAARGLHIDNVSHIYNFDIPKDSKDYVHRIGRTARAGEEGKAINILADVDYDNFSRIIQEYPDFNIKCGERPHVKRVITVSTPNRGRSFNHRRRQFRRGRPN
ncbi:MAG: DEAD/DEAH box helicase [Candidatus Woesearchaeota archaeon]